MIKRTLKKSIISIVFAAFAVAFAMMQFAGVQSAKAVDTEVYEILVREPYVSITDSGRLNQHCDTVQLPASRASFKAKKFSVLTITVYGEYWEKDDGYQHVFIYSGPAREEKDLGGYGLEHSPGKVSTEIKTFVAPFAILLSDLTYDEFAIRYGASGNGADTWYNSNINVVLIFS